MTTKTERNSLLPPDMPRAMRQLPRDSVGRPVPRFVQWLDGTPDFRILDSDHLLRCVREWACWVCGEELKKGVGRVHHGTFVVGPMCVVNRNSAEPPSHADCAEWSARACPFLANPSKVRREANLPEDLAGMPGIGIMRNPGVTALVESPTWRIERDGPGLLFRFNIANVTWLARGAPASDAEVLYSIETGLPALIEMTVDEPGAMLALGKYLHRALTWVPTPPDESYPLIHQVLAAQP